MYLYIFEVQTMWQEKEKPNKDNLKCIEDGFLTVVEINEGIFFDTNPDGSVIEIKGIK